MQQYVVPVQVPTLDPASAPIIKRFQQVWTPTIMLLAPDGKVYDEWNGYLPPGLFLPRLLLGLGKAELKQDRLEAAARCFDEIAAKYPLSDVAPEALYWAAVSRYKASHQAEDLLGGWRKLQSRYPESPWRVRQSFIEG
ncbi:MAG TPA: hypothetical protein VII06_19355 [Chloroflexota bacterium]|jgi:tetratricopeptide (TPR) repeat protein